MSLEVDTQGAEEGDFVVGLYQVFILTRESEGLVAPGTSSFIRDIVDVVSVLPRPETSGNGSPVDAPPGVVKCPPGRNTLTFEQTLVSSIS